MNDILSRYSSQVTLLDFLQELRPRQWTKNVIVLAGFVFALGDKQQSVSPGLLWTAILAAVLFSIAASGVYVFNDILDRDRDRMHPFKSQRPVAAGRLSLPMAWSMVFTCLVTALIGSWFLGVCFGLVVTSYVLLQALYTLKLKHIPLLDVFIIAIGFVLRVVAGGFAVHVDISSWSLICTFLMALFLALCKRRHEKRMMDENRMDAIRPSLVASDVRLLDQLIAIIAGAVIVAYAVYTQWPDTIEKFQTSYLSLTIPFVIFGLFRYLHLVYQQSKGDQPEYILLTDIPLIVNVLLFGFSVLLITLV